ncbi:hypothetical protein NZ698_15560 [Chryseobacterium sp. PBS4-4]|uniref:DUF4848 domain-containing protein n=1 Tax=Chryseobacterium edaphi TaxID=2976532 RepID=A0ABT2W8R0_9FLAO|nr:hypothetical protein [Chryseobacterium edaphi]MCU7618611.1 hypothetical protein [Chryseobacterium edaphi]
MRKIRILKIALLGIFAFTISCSDELLNTTVDNSAIVEGTLKNGRLFFPNKESLNATFKELKSKNHKYVDQYVKEKGIESLVPIINENSEQQVIELLKKRKTNYLAKNASRVSGEISPVLDQDIYEDLDDLEEIVGDETFAAMLNGSAEIQVANNIYKYTDVGLFVTEEQNYNNLETYLEVRQISSNLLEPTEPQFREDFLAGKIGGELQTLQNTNNKINYFISQSIYPTDETNPVGSSPATLYPGGGYSGGSTVGGSTGGGSTSTPAVEPSFASIVEGLKVGDIRKPLLGNIFGKTWETDDKYESKRRVKVKFYSQNLYLVYAIGCKVKHQYKGWTGIWRGENADQLGIGVNSIKWTFSHPVNMSSPAGVPKQAYWFGSNAYFSSASGITFSFSQNQNIPSLPFASQLDGVIQFVVDQSGLTEQQLDKLFWENAWKQANQFLEGQNKKLNRVAFIVDSYNASYVKYYDFSQVENNQDVIERIFDWGIATPQFTYTFGGGTGNGVAVTSYNWNFSKPTAVNVNMYGIAKKNGGWHGAKLIID